MKRFGIGNRSRGRKTGRWSGRRQETCQKVGRLKEWSAHRPVRCSADKSWISFWGTDWNTRSASALLTGATSANERHKSWRRRSQTQASSGPEYSVRFFVGPRWAARRSGWALIIRCFACRAAPGPPGSGGTSGAGSWACWGWSSRSAPRQAEGLALGSGTWCGSPCLRPP